jgi:hypothetical protein
MNFVDLVAAAAFTAAALSLVNVGVSAWLNSRGHLEQWRRDVERPIVAQIITLSGDALNAWQDASFARQEWIASVHADPNRQHEDIGARDRAAEQWAVGSGAYDKLRFEMAQLNLIAGPPLRDVAGALLRQHESMRHYIRPTNGASNWFDLVTNLNNEIVTLQRDLVVKTRADLGLDRGVTSHRLRSLLSRARRNAARL